MRIERIEGGEDYEYNLTRGLLLRMKNKGQNAAHNNRAQPDLLGQHNIIFFAIGDAWTVLHLVEADHHIKQEMSSCPNTNYDRKHIHSPE